MTDNDKLDAIRDRAIDLVAAALDDEDISAYKRADMALSLLGKQALKQQDTAQDAEPAEPVEIVFRILAPGEDAPPTIDHTMEHKEAL